MRSSRPTLILLGSQTAAAQWAPFATVEDGFSATFPGKPKVESTTYATEYRMTLPARARAEDALGQYSTTVVDYRGPQKLHDDAVAKCRGAKGANGMTATRARTIFASRLPARWTTPHGT